MTCSAKIETNITGVASIPRRFSYNSETKTLSVKGVMTEDEKETLHGLCSDNESDAEAIDTLFEETKNNLTGVGVYGWLEKPGAQGAKQQSDGFLQAPSLNRAITGALLRSAALSEMDNEKHPFSINLSSRRVKRAMSFTEGLQNGYTPAELLGYQVERKLHELGLDHNLLDFGKTTPLLDSQKMM